MTIEERRRRLAAAEGDLSGAKSAADERRRRMNLIERIDLIDDARRMEIMLSDNKLSKQAKTLLQKSIQQKVQRCEALRTGKPMPKPERSSREIRTFDIVLDASN